jgi:hypothetical protein
MTNLVQWQHRMLRCEAIVHDNVMVQSNIDATLGSGARLACRGKVAG